MSDQQESTRDTVVDVSHITAMPSEDFRKLLERVSPALRAVLERHRARSRAGADGGTGACPDGGSFNSFIEPSL